MGLTIIEIREAIKNQAAEIADRRAFIAATKEYLGKDHTGMDDETQSGELYLDSFEYRRLGIAKKLVMTKIL